LIPLLVAAKLKGRYIFNITQLKIIQMEKVIKKSWYKNYALWGLLVAIIAGIIIPIVVNKSKSEDFTIEVTPFEAVVEKGNSINARISVSSKEYDGQIRLTTKSQNDDIDIIFNPSTGNISTKFESELTINVSNSIEVGDYTLEIIGIGSKNNIEHTTSIKLEVKNPPFAIRNLDELFYPDGFMGDINSIRLNYYSSVNPFEGESCVKIDYSGKGEKGWAGIYWLYPNNNWGKQATGRDLIGANKLTFYARGEQGGEKAEFKIGGVTGKFEDSANPPKTISVALTSSWQEYTINLNDLDLSNVFGGFCWETNSAQNPNGCIVYLDKIEYK